MVGRVREVLHPLGVVGPPDEALRCEAVGADIDEASEGTKDKGGDKVLQNLLPRSFSPQFLDIELILQSTEVDPLKDFVPGRDN